MTYTFAHDGFELLLLYISEEAGIDLEHVTIEEVPRRDGAAAYTLEAALVAARRSTQRPFTTAAAFGQPAWFPV
jgi:hypothetical protein